MASTYESDPCSSNGPAALNPKNSSLLVLRGSCRGTQKAGFYEWSATPLTEQRLLYQSPEIDEGSPINRKPAWLPDGSGFHFLVQGPKRVPEDRLHPNRHGLALWTAATGAVKVVYMPDNDATDVENVAVSPRGEVVLEVSKASGATKTHDLHLLQLDSGTLSPLTTSGDNHRPGW
jgi:hypothetical protein